MKEKQELKILLIDDHNLILDAYKNVLSKLEGIKISIDIANNCDVAWEKIVSSNYDIVLLDINFPVYDESKILSGEDLASKLRHDFPKIKIIILTLLEDTFRLYNILKIINPDGFLLKGETNSKELLKCFESIIDSNNYYSPKITKIQYSAFKLNFSLDEKDRIILNQLSLGTKTKDLTTHVNLSLRAVEDRKRKLKEIFDVVGEGNQALLKKARSIGYV